MSRLAGYLISARHQSALRLGLWAIAFLVLVAFASGLVAQQVTQTMRQETRRLLADYDRLRSNVVAAHDQMEMRLQAEPCSAPFIEEMRRIAFLPDGLNELFYVRDGAIACTANLGVLPETVALGTADVTITQPLRLGMWLDVDLAPLHLPGLTGSYATRGNFGVVVPTQALPTGLAHWMDQELVLRIDEDTWWHRAGAPGLYLQAHPQAGGSFALVNGALFSVECDSVGFFCVAGRAGLQDLFTLGWTTVGVILAVAGILAAWVAQLLHGAILRYWSLEARFLRHLSAETIVCYYQPLFDLRQGKVSGCEVLARWRDVEGAILPPDRFLPFVEKHELTLRFTELVVQRAAADLADIPLAEPLQVNFNIFPGDLDAARLLPLFADLLAQPQRYTVVIEIVESGEVHLEAAINAIAQLREAGLKVFIDDFGAGYSSLHNLAALPLDGVKLDRSFAMAPDHSVMALMLGHAIDLVASSGRILVAEGVETGERLEALRETGKVEFAQGYFISRPLPADGFARFLEARAPLPGRPRLVA